MPVDTVPGLFLNAVRTYDKPDAFQHKVDGAYRNVSHRYVFEAVDGLSRGLLALGHTKGDRIALLSENRLEWALADMAILSCGCITVPVYPSLPAAQVEYILADSEARTIFVSSGDNLRKVLSVRKNLGNLQRFIVFGDEACRDPVLSLSQIKERGNNWATGGGFEERIATIGRYDWASIIYTSGTTGEPKGVILNHWNFLSNVLALRQAVEIGPTDRCLSFLPLSHVFERTGGFYTMFDAGVTIAYAESFDTIGENLVETEPTVVNSVPRLYEKMYARILDAVTAGSFFKKTLFFWAVDVGRRRVRQQMEDRLTTATRIQDKLADRLVFRKLRASTGGRLRFFVSGGAPLAREIAEFFFAVGLPIYEGYGLTETSPVIALNTADQWKLGTVGKPVPGVDIRIAEDGEILARGPNVMLGYYKKPDKTKKVLDGEWFHTGDIGYLDEDGFLTITDRKKDLIVTAGGKNVAPQPIENLFKTNKYVAQAVVVGNGRKFISAIIVPNFRNLMAFADATGIRYANEDDLIHNPQVVHKYHDEIERMSQHLASFERVKKIILVERDFSIEAGELTPSLKVKRRTIEARFEAAIDALYEEQPV